MKFLALIITSVFTLQAYASEPVSNCWKQVLRANPWIKTSQIGCIESNPAAKRSLDALCSADQEKLHPDFEDFVSYMSEILRIAKLMNENNDPLTEFALSQKYESAESAWMSHPGYGSVSSLMGVIASAAHSPECSKQ